MGKPPTKWIVYIVECADQSLYTGITIDIEARIDLHNAGKAAKYTRGRGPVRLVYQENVSSKGDALRREYMIKQLSTAAKHHLILKNSPTESIA